MIIRLNLDNTSYIEKPKGKEGIIKTNLADKARDITPEDLIKAIENGQTFTPAELDGTNETAWKSQQIIVADIDNEYKTRENRRTITHKLDDPLTPEQARDVLASHNLPYYFMYYTFRHGPELPKFRVVMVLNEKLTTLSDAREITAKLTQIFNTYKPKCADTSINNGDRFIYGTKAGRVFDIKGQTTDAQKLRDLPGEPESAPDLITAELAQIAQDAYNAQATQPAPSRNGFLDLNATIGGDIYDLTEEERQAIRAEINARPLTYFIPLTPSPKAGKNMYICPLCNSGNGDHQTGALSIAIKRGRYIVSCFSCHGFLGAEYKGSRKDGADTLGALRKIWNCNETEAFIQAGYNKKPAQIIKPKQTQAQAVEDSRPKDYADKIKAWASELKQSAEKGPKMAREYLEARGISTETAARYNIGYTAELDGIDRLIIPANNCAFTARRIDGSNEKAKTKRGPASDLFNAGAFNTHTVLFVVEGELDALSINQATSKAAAIATRGTYTEDILRAAKDHPSAFYFIAYDNDQDGQEAQTLAHDKFKAAGLRFMCISEHLYGEAKDANEAYITDRQTFTDKLDKLINKAAQYLEELEAKEQEAQREQTGAGMLDAFIKSIRTEKYKPVETGLYELDKALNGGLIRKTLVTLGAAPGMGKTSLAQFILENMAQSGHDVLYINLEMARDQLLSRSLARTLERNREAIEAQIGAPFSLDAAEIMRGYSWTLTQERAFYAAVDIYRENIAQRFIYNPNEADTNKHKLSNILATIKKEVNRLKAAGKPAPLVCIDYLHLIDYDLSPAGSRKPDLIEGLKETITALKELALNEDLIIILITANNRESNKRGTASMESGRDTSNIEYTADVMLGLTYTAIADGERQEDENGIPSEKYVTKAYIDRLINKADLKGEPRPEIANRVCLEVLKNRFGPNGRRARFIFDGRSFDYKEEQAQPLASLAATAPTLDGSITDPEDGNIYEQIDAFEEREDITF